MRELRNSEIAKFVEEELNKKGHDISFARILDGIDGSRDEEDEELKLSEEEIKVLKETILDSFLAEYEN